MLSEVGRSLSSRDHSPTGHLSSSFYLPFAAKCDAERSLTELTSKQTATTVGQVPWGGWCRVLGGSTGSIKEGSWDADEGREDRAGSQMCMQGLYGWEKAVFRNCYGDTHPTDSHASFGEAGAS